MNTQPRIYKIAEPWCSCSFTQMPDVGAALRAIRLVEPCWAHEFVGPPGLGSGFHAGDVREYLLGSPVSLAVNRAIESAEQLGESLEGGT